MTGDNARAQGARQQQPPNEQATRMKIISFGSEAVGKSCLVKRYCEEKFVSKYISTIGVDFGVRPVKVAGQTTCAIYLQTIHTPCTGRVHAVHTPCTRRHAHAAVHTPCSVATVCRCINFFDFAGGAEYFEIRREFYSDAQGGLLVFDVSGRESFEALEGWLAEAKAQGADRAVLVVCANKTDCKKRTVRVCAVGAGRGSGFAVRGFAEPRV